MKAVLAAEIGEQLVLSLTMTKKELADAMADPQLLLEALRGACGGIDPELQEKAMCGNCGGIQTPSAPEEDACAGEDKDTSSGSGEFIYKDLAISGLSGDRETVIERALAHLIARNEIPVDMAAVDSEADYNFKAVMQRMRYDVLFGTAPESGAQVDPDELMAEIREDLILEQKENYIYKKIIELEGFEVSPGELLFEAEAMARRQDTTVDMVRSFFGEDLAGLAGDVKKRKARDFLYALATGEQNND